MAKKTDGVAVAEPTGTMAEYLKTLPPIPDDPETYWSEDETQDVASDQEEDGAEALATDEGEEGGEETGRERGPDGRFIAKEKAEEGKEEAVSSTDKTAETEAAADPMAALLSQLDDDQRQAFEFSQALATAEDPIALLAQQAEAANLKTALLERLGIPKEMIEQLDNPLEKAGIDPEYEPTAYEQVLMPHIDKLAKFPESVAEIAKPLAVEAVNEYTQRMLPYIDASNIEMQLASMQVAALAEAMGINMPKVDRNAIMKELNANPNTTYGEAVAKVVGDGIKTAVADFKQAKKPRPETPGNEQEGISLDDLPRDRKEFGVTDAKEIYRRMFGRGR